MKKNKRVIILLSVLILGIGGSLAYFVGKTIFSGTGATTEGRTATVNGSTLDVKGTLEFDDPDIYPGHKKVSKIEVTAIGDNEFIAYNLIWEGTNGLGTPLKYTVYKTSDDIEVSATCEKKKKVKNGIQYLNEECSISNIDQLGDKISEGEISKTEGETLTKEIITNNQYITSKEKAGERDYYYIIIEYPNLTEEINKDQNEDIGHNFDGRVYAKINNKNADINILGIYIKDEETGDYKEAEQMPDKNYMLVESKCSNDAEAVTDLEDNTIKIKNLSLEGTNCYLYYDKQSSNKTLTALGIKDSKEKVGSITGPSCEPSSETCYSDSNHNNMKQNGVYETEDDYGTSYVFRGTIANNWVKFGKMTSGSNANQDIWWRIIRINGNGTIRLIYAGSGSSAPKTNTNVTEVSAKPFNSSANDNTYAGFKYGLTGQNTHISTHTNTNKSAIMEELERWYGTTNLNTLESKIDVETGFCNDRELAPAGTNLNLPGGGSGIQKTAYAPLGRLFYNNNYKTEQTPTLKCGYDVESQTTNEKARKRDLFTGPSTKESQGNNELTNPVGLITSDEVIYAGGFYGQSNNKYWLYTDEGYWTMSPSNFSSNNIYIFLVNSYGNLGDGNTASTSFGVRPVINLKPDTIFKTQREEDKGISTNPYIVE